MRMLRERSTGFWNMKGRDSPNALSNVSVHTGAKFRPHACLGDPKPFNSKANEFARTACGDMYAGRCLAMRCKASKAGEEKLRAAKSLTGLKKHCNFAAKLGQMDPRGLTGAKGGSVGKLRSRVKAVRARTMRTKVVCVACAEPAKNLYAWPDDALFGAKPLSNERKIERWLKGLNQAQRKWEQRTHWQKVESLAWYLRQMSAETSLSCTTCLNFRYLLGGRPKSRQAVESRCNAAFPHGDARTAESHSTCPKVTAQVANPHVDAGFDTASQQKENCSIRWK